jgi:hypothetical protein
MQLTLADRIDAVEVPDTARPRLRLVAPGESVERPRHRDPRPIAENFARGVAEVMARARSVDQLRDLATFEVVRIIERATSRQPSSPLRPAMQPRLRSVHLAAPCDGVIEACAVIDGGVRTRALAFRLESNGIAWRATVLQLG